MCNGSGETIGYFIFPDDFTYDDLSDLFYSLDGWRSLLFSGDWVAPLFLWVALKSSRVNRIESSYLLHGGKKFNQDVTSLLLVVTISNLF